MDEKYEGLRVTSRLLLPAITLLISLLVLAGWQFNIPFLIRPLPQLDAMNPMSCISFSIASLAILPLLLRLQTTWLINLSRTGALLLLWAGLMRTTDLAGLTNFNVDQWLYAPQMQAGLTGGAGTRQGLGVSLGFIALALALLFATFNSIKLKRAANGLASTLIAGAALFLLCYLYQAPEFYALLALLPISVQSAVCFLILGRAIWAINNNAYFIKTYHSSFLGGILVRRLVPVVLAVPVGMGFITLCLHWLKPLSVELDIVILITSIVLVLLVMVAYLGKQLNISDKARTRAENDLKDFNKKLERAVTERTNYLHKANRLYSLLSAINQSIVHKKNVPDLLENICRVATDLGGLKMAWTALVTNTGNYKVMAISGPAHVAGNIALNNIIDYREAVYQSTLIDKLLLTGNYVVCNHAQTDPLLQTNWQALKASQIQAVMALPIKKMGRIAGFFIVYATTPGFFDIAEIALLEEAAGDISFALEVIEKEEQRLQVQNKLVVSEALLNRAQRVAHVGHWQLDLTSGMAKWSDEACCIFGLSTGDNEQSFEFWKSFLHPDDAAAILETLQLVQQNLNHYQLDHRIVWRNGTVRYVHSDFKYEYDATGKPVGLYGVVHDITERKLAEMEIRALNESLEQKVKERTEQLIEANKDLEAFNYTVSHDLQSPLRSLSGFSKILLLDYKDKLDEEGREFLNIIDSNARRMSDLIRDLLNFARMGKEPLKVKETDMTQLAQAAINDIKNITPHFKTQITLHPLPNAQCDASLMLQVWVNLISNAVKYSGKKAEPKIEIGPVIIDGETVYYVKDNGVGFAMQQADKLFKVFQRMHSQNEFEGTGVGLTTAHRIIHRHGGQIWAEGAVDEGATFYFTLP